MPLMETLQPEAGDDRDKKVEIQRLNEMYYGPDATGIGDIALLDEIDKLLDDSPVSPEYGPGDRVLQRTSKFGHAVLMREHIKWPQIHH